MKKYIIKNFYFFKLIGINKKIKKIKIHILFDPCRSFSNFKKLEKLLYKRKKYIKKIKNN